MPFDFLFFCLNFKRNLLLKSDFFKNRHTYESMLFIEKIEVIIKGKYREYLNLINLFS